jgi:flagellar export protein FliJ
MAFRFALAPLLRLRQSVERQRTLRLQEASLQVSRAQEMLAQIDGSISAREQSDAHDLTRGQTGAELQFASVVRENLLQFREQLKVNIHKLELQREQAAAEYQQAYRDRELLETVRTRQHRLYQQEQLRRQQRELDAAYVLQRWHRRD